MDIVQGYSGVWVGQAPFLLPSLPLTCTGVGSFISLESTGFNILNKVYDANGLTKEQYTQDKQAGAELVTLTDSTGLSHHIPSLYLTTIPRYKAIPYNRLMIGLDAGVCYSGIDLEALKDELKVIASDFLGLTVKVSQTRIPVNIVVDEKTHSDNEVARQANVVFSDSDKLKLAKSEARVDELLERINVLEEIIRDLTP